MRPRHRVKGNALNLKAERLKGASAKTAVKEWHVAAETAAASKMEALERGENARICCVVEYEAQHISADG